ncbi:cytidine/deoxycytidylate deaminase family protein [Patescibacteria group bacterium]
MKKQVDRLSKEDYQRLITFFVSTRGTCNRLRTATTLWDKKGRMISGGYNGSPPKDGHCDDLGHLLIDNHCVRTNHGEINSVFNAVDLRRLENATARILGTPCYDCTRFLVSNGIKEIEFIGGYENAKGKDLISDLCEKKGVLVFSLEFDFVRILQQAVDFLQGPGGSLKDLPDIHVGYVQ